MDSEKARKILENHLENLAKYTATPPKNEHELDEFELAVYAIARILYLVNGGKSNE